MQTKQLRLLLIDDDELDRVAVMRALRQSALDFQIEQAATAADGIRLAANERFDAVLLDYRLPDQDGLAVLQALRSDECSSVAVLMLSRYEDDLIADQCIEAGAQDFLLKDEVNARRLRRAVRLAQQRYAMSEALKVSNDKLRTLSERDSLTGLTNRRGFEISLNSAIVRAKHAHVGLAVLLLDLDGFKDVNDTFGHDAGDELLIEITRRLRLLVRDGDVLARLGGDEFVILAKHLEQDTHAAYLADRIISAFQEPMHLHASELVVTASIGIAVLDERASNASDLLKHADIAMYRAKRDGRNQCRFYSEQLHDVVQLQTSLKRDLQRALERNELQLFFQAKVKAYDKTLGGVEALIRWQHPILGLLGPSDFISIAEETGMIVDIGSWVLDQACRQLADWQARFPQLSNDLSVSVNLSAVQLRQNELISSVQAALIRHQIPAKKLELEITENALIEDHAGAIVKLRALSEMGVALSLDDFGTGYSSMEHLQIFPIDILKIDQTFVANIGTNAHDDLLLIAMIKFAQTLRLKIVAEGVETEEQATFCINNGCHLLQGYCYSRAVTATEFEHHFFQ
jgi:diguanylate cyclase